MTLNRYAMGCVALACAVTAVNAAAAPAQATAPSLPPVVASPHPVYSQAMQKLQATAQRLRESIQNLAQKPPGPERQVAIDAARDALLKTQQAMLDLPPEDRVRASAPGTAGYDASVRKLMAAADGLRHSIQEMATQPAGPRRNQAIRDANRALLETQGAMANAYDLTAFPAEHTLAASTTTMECVRLEGMTACQRK